jgi:hypothetical protein
MTLIKMLHNMFLGGQRPKSAIEALNKGVTKMLFYKFI